MNYKLVYKNRTGDCAGCVGEFDGETCESLPSECLIQNSEGLFGVYSPKEPCYKLVIDPFLSDPCTKCCFVQNPNTHGDHCNRPNKESDAFSCVVRNGYGCHSGYYIKTTEDKEQDNG